MINEFTYFWIHLKMEFAGASSYFTSPISIGSEPVWKITKQIKGASRPISYLIKIIRSGLTSNIRSNQYSYA